MRFLYLASLRRHGSFTHVLVFSRKHDRPSSRQLFPRDTTHLIPSISLKRRGIFSSLCFFPKDRYIMFHHFRPHLFLSRHSWLVTFGLLILGFYHLFPRYILCFCMFHLQSRLDSFNHSLGKNPANCIMC